MKHFSLILFGLISTFTLSQDNTVGVIVSMDEVTEGYTLFNPDRNKNVYLINNCGEVVNEWEFSEKPGQSSYLLENGNLLVAGKDSLEIRDWNNTLIWSVGINETFGFNQHHDIEPLPNGNILLVVNDNYDSTDMFPQGLREDFGSASFKLDKIVEIQPTGSTGANIVWEWKFYDHLIQDLDNTKPNFGVIDEHPELLDMNYLAENESDFTHVNAVDYNADLDQILISARHTNEIYIVDHSTTTVEAASNTGGNSGKGGGFIWRWGNPQVYSSNFSDVNQTLGRQHDCKWIDGALNAGKISVFSNASVNTGFGSEVGILTPVTDGYNYGMDNGIFLPNNFSWSWYGELMGESLNVAIKSGVQILPNGNALIIESTKGKISEIDSLGNLVWLYEIPHGAAIFNQFEDPTNNGTFRATKYAPDYAGFDNVEFNNTGIIENENILSSNCMSLGLSNADELTNMQVFPNPSHDQLTLKSRNALSTVALYNLIGKRIKVLNPYTNSVKIDVSELVNGTYIVYSINVNGDSTQHKIQVVH